MLSSVHRTAVDYIHSSRSFPIQRREICNGGEASFLSYPLSAGATTGDEILLFVWIVTASSTLIEHYFPAVNETFVSHTLRRRETTKQQRGTAHPELNPELNVLHLGK